MDIESDSEPLSEPPSTIEVPTDLQKTFDFDSRAQEIDTARDSSSFSNDKYKGLDWLKFPGFQIPPPSKRDRRSHIWKYCYAIYQTETGNLYAVCQICHIKHKTKYATDHRWLDASTGRAAEHLLKKHNIGKNGPIKLSDQSQSVASIRNKTPTEQAELNQRRRSFDERRFQKLLTRWVIQDGIAFN